MSCINLAWTMAVINVITKDLWWLELPLIDYQRQFSLLTYSGKCVVGEVEDLRKILQNLPEFYKTKLNLCQLFHSLSYFLFLISYFLFLTSYFLLLTSYFLLLTSWGCDCWKHENTSCKLSDNQTFVDVLKARDSLVHNKCLSLVLRPHESTNTPNSAEKTAKLWRSWGSKQSKITLRQNGSRQAQIQPAISR